MTAHDVHTAAAEGEARAGPEPAHGAEIVVPLNRLPTSRGTPGRRSSAPRAATTIKAVHAGTGMPPTSLGME
jgi:hypothetical protein